MYLFVKRWKIGFIEKKKKRKENRIYAERFNASLSNKSFNVLSKDCQTPVERTKE